MENISMTELFGDELNRSESDSIKWQQYGKDVIPMWVADTDFAIAPCITEAITQRNQHAVLGYPHDLPSLKQVITDYCQTQLNWAIDPDWIKLIPGVVKGLNIVRAMAVDEARPLTLTTLPVYPHVYRPSPIVTASKTITVDALPPDAQCAQWRMDFDAIEKAFIEHDGKIGAYFLCNPHNPIGRAYRKDELQTLADLCEKYDVMICSDDIHCDFILDDCAHPHTPIATLSEQTQQRTITLMAASKTFNIAGLCGAFAIISDDALRNRFESFCYGLVGDVNIFAQHAAQAAYTDGVDWMKAQVHYLSDNARVVHECINAMPYLSCVKTEATYLMWINVSKLMAHGVDNPQQFFKKAGVALMNGVDFSPQLSQYLRLNFGCQRPLLVDALDRMEQALNQLN